MTAAGAGIELGLQIVPTMPPGEAVETIRAAEELGYSYAMVADEGLMLDPYALLGAAAGATTAIRLGSVTNGYTRHPAATAAALATVDQMSGGRAFVTLVAGGTMVLRPMGIERAEPLAVMADAIEMMRLLWGGEPVTWQGRRFRLEEARIETGPHRIPVFVAARGPGMLKLAGARADGVVLMVKSDLGDALALAEAPHGVRVNAVAPGLIATEALLSGMPGEDLQAAVQRHIPGGRFGRPEEIAAAILFAASDEASYLNGAVLPVDAALGAREAGPD